MAREHSTARMPLQCSMRQQGLPLLPKRRCSLRALASVACVMVRYITATFDAIALVYLPMR